MHPEDCPHDNTAPREMLDGLHESQGAGRHKCCVCAYAEGLREGRSRAAMGGLGRAEECQEGLRASSDMLDALPVNQGGTGRHKCPICAYHAGFSEGRRIAMR